jgi:hypothetical protein
MTPDNENLDHLVLFAVADDYEKFEMIASDITKRMSLIVNIPDIDKIEYALLKAIANKDVNAYEYSEITHQYISADIDSHQISTFWFYITDQGKKRLELLDTR